MVSLSVVVDSYAVLRRVRLLFFVRMRRFIPIPVVVGLRVHVEVDGVVLYALVRMRVGVPVRIRMSVAHLFASLYASNAR